MLWHFVVALWIVNAFVGREVSVFDYTDVGAFRIRNDAIGKRLEMVRKILNRRCRFPRTCAIRWFGIVSLECSRGRKEYRAVSRENLSSLL